MTLSERLKEARKKAGKTQAEVAKAANISQPAYQALESGRNQKTASLYNIAQYLDVDINWLASGDTHSVDLIKDIRNVIPVAPKMAPVLSWVQAGVFTNVESVDMSQVEEWLPLPDDCDECFYLKVQGLSNYPTFHEGDYILVDPTVQYDQMQSGDLIVVRKHDEATFKRLVIETDNSRYLQALNPEFKPNIIPLDEDCIFVGEVIDSIRYIYRSKRKNKMRKS